ncbi:uncharacterized protein [Spinacia oleracea]|uniref:Reverse transcriptase zinc-binding domain-containing protein n=1 Tax=Spinacia oleracea TaxID=3562 RepID=A0ABM3RJ73_SPIOL|nr:uncharacterized protein LOC110779830 [Spinacia oleracea]
MKGYLSFEQVVAMPKYSIKLAYNSLLPVNARQPWATVIWDRLGVPKHRFITWLAMLDRLNTKEKLMKIGVTDDNLCLLCGTVVENQNHLFFSCEYSSKCWDNVSKWLGIAPATSDLHKLIHWVQKRKISKFRKGVIITGILCTVYHIWKERNNALWNAQIRRIDKGSVHRFTCVSDQRACPLDLSLSCT